MQSTSQLNTGSNSVCTQEIFDALGEPEEEEEDMIDLITRVHLMGQNGRIAFTIILALFRNLPAKGQEKQLLLSNATIQLMTNL